MAQYTSLNVNIQDPGLAGLLASFGASSNSTPPEKVNSDGWYLNLRLLQPSVTSYRPWDDVPGTPQIYVTLDLPNQVPLQGQFNLQFSSVTTSNQNWSEAAESLQSALNSLASISAAGGVTVTLAPNGVDYVVSFNTVGAQNLMSGQPLSLYPASTITIVREQVGTSSLSEIQVVKIRQIPACYSGPTAWTQSATPNYAFNSIQTGVAGVSGAAGVNAVQLLTLFPLPYSGFMSITTNYGTTAQFALPATAATIQNALNSISSAAAGKYLVVGNTNGPYAITDLNGVPVSLYTATGANILVPVVYQGLLQLNTPGMLARFQTAGSLTGDIQLTLEVKIQNSGESPQTVLQVPITVNEAVLASGISPVQYPSYVNGITSIASGAGQVVVSGLSLGFTPTKVRGTVQTNGGGSVFYATPDTATYSPAGFTFNIGPGSVPDASYSLLWEILG